MISESQKWVIGIVVALVGLLVSIYSTEIRNCRNKLNLFIGLLIVAAIVLSTIYLPKYIIQFIGHQLCLNIAMLTAGVFIFLVFLFILLFKRDGLGRIRPIFDETRRKLKAEQIEKEKALVLKDSQCNAFKRILENKKLIYRYTDYFPFSSQDGVQEPTGIAIDIIKEIASRLGIEAKRGGIVKWSEIHNALDKDECDIVSYVWRTEDRAKIVSSFSPFIAVG